MSSATPKSGLSRSRRQFLEMLQRLNFGRIENLAIRDGDPVLNPVPRIVLEVKFGGENGPRPELQIGDFELKQRVVELFAYFDRVRDARIEVLTIKHGLPFGMNVEATL